MRDQRVLAPCLALFLVMLAVGLGASCSSGGSGHEGGTPMDGSVACYDKTCAGGQLCSSCVVSPDGSVPPVGACHDVPAGCEVDDCAYGECPGCLDLCWGQPGSVAGRILECACLQ